MFLLGGWVLAGRMLAPLTRTADATRMAADGPLSHRVRLQGRRDQFREAISQTLLEVARTDPARDQGELIEHLHTVNTPAIDLTEALLPLSRGNCHTITREPVDLSLIAEQATTTPRAAP